MPHPFEDESATGTIQALPPAASAVKHPKPRQSLPSAAESSPLSLSESNLPLRRANPQAASLYASTLSPPTSRPMSPAGRGSPSRVLAGTVFDAPTNKALPEAVGENPGDPLNLILKAFVPHISVYASEDTEHLIQQKGFKNGLWELLRPFGERIQGKVSIRDSNGISKTTDDFSVRFTKFGANIENPEPAVPGLRNAQPAQGQNGAQGSAKRDRIVLNNVESVVERHLSFAEESYLGLPNPPSGQRQLDIENPSPYYALYLRRLLSGLPMAPHETFAHPVACVMAISSRNEAPIEALRKLYNETSQGEKKLPPWIDGDYLRYYVLVHDEENDDITRSMGLFEQMKRHLGLHCHLLRVRSTQSAETDDDSIPLPRSEWMSAAEELAELQRSEEDEVYEDQTKYIFETDATAIRSFIREMVIQSIVPTMERHMSIWNDQVASRRRGIAGRFMSMSRKWTFGGSSKSSTGGSGSNGRDSYEAQGYFRADTPEAIIRKLADYAFMLRDWKLAHSTYDLIRADFADSKAWKYHAAANEMAAITMLIMPQQLSSKTRSETIDAMLDGAFYTYSTRCSSPFGAMRSLTLAVELLRLRGGTNIDDAGRWGLRLLESRILGLVGDALIKERLAVCYASKQGVGNWRWGIRQRKSAAWSMLAAEAWNRQNKQMPAQRCLEEAEATYSLLPHKQGISGFKIASEYMALMHTQLSRNFGATTSSEGGGHLEPEAREIEEENETLTDMRRGRASSVIRTGIPETAPLHGDEEKAGPLTEESSDAPQFD